MFRKNCPKAQTKKQQLTKKQQPTRKQQPSKVKLAIYLLSCFLLLSLNSCFKTNKAPTQISGQTQAESDSSSSLGTANNSDFDEWLVPLLSEYLQDDNTSTATYDIELQFSGTGFTDARKQVFQDAAQVWKTAIIGDVSNRIVGSNWTDCDDNPYTVNSIDDLLIQAKIAPIDGPGGTLGSAGPRFVRTNSNELGIPITGCMTFDSADIVALELDGTFPGVILHEMGHVIGVGTIWNYTSNTTCPTNFAFTGTNAVGEWNTLGGTGILPVEDGGGSGTQCGHWDEETFDTELMTGYVDSFMQMSRLTIASLEDLKYVVNYGAADAYSLPGCSGACGASQGVGANSVAWEQILTPIPIPDE